MSFKDKVVVVTGSSSGIGAATAKAFAKEGAKVALVGRRAERLKQVERECEILSGASHLTLVADVSKDDEARAIISKTVERYGRLDVLVNNAGIVSVKTILDPDYVTEFDRIMGTNLRAAVVVTNAALPHLVKTKGNIVNVSSIAGTSPTAMCSHYAASKAGLDHFREEAGKSLPLGFISKSEEVADLILYLASEKAKSITGSTNSYLSNQNFLILSNDNGRGGFSNRGQHQEHQLEQRAYAPCDLNFLALYRDFDEETTDSSSFEEFMNLQQEERVEEEEIKQDMTDEVDVEEYGSD
ncbi:11-beta-hydroxysteroid dehydrogenase-like 4B [Eumeta japonica]|uniref:11-beta-hydroxysteroid dehydrogenase-like 4B n=1 Tax=Eumeta variegata TaxID=151549 RepID=A0A4C1Z9R1_EUMVA|nr:11-beta-hydroxysteroid dehydrogenase-like 4B [Eumeta japonica]